MRMFAACIIGTLFASPGTAQRPVYRLSVGDTLRYREITESTVELRTPQRPVTLTSQHDGVVVVVRERGDTAAAWYQQLTLSSASPFGEKRPNTESALRQPFRVVFKSNGAVTLISAPTFALEIAEQTDLSRQFDDFFISVPAVTLRPEAAWSDTLTSSKPAAGDGREHSQSRHIRRFRVLRDTVVSGAPAVVIAVDQEMEMQSSSPMKNQPVIIETRLQGKEQGFAVFAVRAGRLLSRERHGHLEGQQVLRGQAREMTVPMVYDYTSSLSLFP